MIKKLLVFFAFSLAANATGPTIKTVAVDSNGVLVAPTNFFATNGVVTNALTNAAAFDTNGAALAVSNAVMSSGFLISNTAILVNGITNFGDYKGFGNHTQLGECTMTIGTGSGNGHVVIYKGNGTATLTVGGSNVVLQNSSITNLTGYGTAALSNSSAFDTNGAALAVSNALALQIGTNSTNITSVSNSLTNYAVKASSYTNLTGYPFLSNAAAFDTNGAAQAVSNALALQIGTNSTNITSVSNSLTNYTVKGSSYTNLTGYPAWITNGSSITNLTGYNIVTTNGATVITNNGTATLTNPTMSGTVLISSNALWTNNATNLLAPFGTNTASNNVANVGSLSNLFVSSTNANYLTNSGSGSLTSLTVTNSLTASNVAVQGSQTNSNNIVLLGVNNTAANQTAAGSSSLMTLGLVNALTQNSIVTATTQVVSNSATLTDIPGTSITLTNGTYIVTYNVAVSSWPTGTGYGAKVAIAFTGTISGEIYGSYLTSTQNTTSTDVYNTPYQFNLEGATFPLTFRDEITLGGVWSQGRFIITVTGAGNLTLQAAQHIATSGQTVSARKSTYISVTKVQ